MSTGSPMIVPAARAAMMSTPGAVISGLRPASPSRGPRLEKSARPSLRSTAPTVSADAAAPGVPTVSSWPSLPAATTNSVPVCAVMSLTAWLSGSVPSVASPPRLMLTTFAPSAAAHSIPAMIQES